MNNNNICRSTEAKVQQRALGVKIRKITVWRQLKDRPREKKVGQIEIT